MFDPSKSMKPEGSGQRGPGRRAGHGLVISWPVESCRSRNAYAQVLETGQRENEGANSEFFWWIEHFNCAERFVHP